MPYGEFLLRLVLAALLGGIVGLEREVHGRPAGIRTYLILSLGTALLMVLSEYLLVAYHAKYPGLAQGGPRSHRRAGHHWRRLSGSGHYYPL